ncbi:MAG TPA: exopolysaccharide Pel transporter PelG [Nitrososphaerales archaeon]|nr:exopolysaccharide Pel transporter PelG [Nitrososphaerales archaeon]
METTPENDPNNSNAFLERAARSVAEVQPRTSSIADTLVFLEVLGYTNRMAVANGYQDLLDLAKKVHQFVSFYDIENETVEATPIPVPSAGRRVAEGLSIAFPWVGSWGILLVFGVSLWLSGIMPLDITTAFIIGVFLGLAVAGDMLGMGRLFTYYDEQGNVSETRRVLKRYYGYFALTLALTASGLTLVCLLTGVSLYLAAIAVFSEGTLSLQLTSYMIIYSRRKLSLVLTSYTSAFLALISVYLFGSQFVPDPTLRYFYALGSGLIVLLIPAAYAHYTIFTSRSTNAASKGIKPSFFYDTAAISVTLPSKSRVQLWEILPFSIYGVLFYGMLFGDRVIAWVFNPVHVVGGVYLPMVFNVTYEIGVDLALLILFPALIVQYIMMAHLHEELYNVIMSRKVSEINKVGQFLRRRYRNLLMSTIGASLLISGLMIYFAPVIIPLLGGSGISTNIFYIAAVSDILMAVFGGNAMFLIFINKIRPLCGIAIVGTLIVMGLGVFFAQFGFENIVFAYLAETIIVALASSILVRRNLGKATSIHFARYV